MTPAREVTIVSGTFWVGVYVDGKLSREDESLSVKGLCDLIGQITPVVLSYVEAKGTRLEGTVLSQGGMPEDLSMALADSLRVA